MIRFYLYIGLVIVLLLVVVWLINLFFIEVREYREAVKEITKAYDFCEYFSDSKRLVASIGEGSDRRTIVGTAKFSETGKLFAICTDDNEYLSSEVLTGRTVAAIEEAEKGVK